MRIKLPKRTPEQWARMKTKARIGPASPEMKAVAQMVARHEARNA